MEKIKEYKEPSNKIEKTLTYLENYGLKRTVVKVANKLRGRDQEHFAYGEFLKNHPLTDEMLKSYKDGAENFEFRPLVSIVIPLYNTPEKFLIELIESVEAQVYDRWQLCLADGSPKEGLFDIVCKAKGAEGDSRISYCFLGKNEGIAGNTNAAIDLAQGDYIAFCDHDDLLRADALYHVVKAFNEDRSIDFVYTDEDKIDMEGKTYFLPHFKSDFNIDLLRSHNYITHFVVCKAPLIKELKVKSDYDGAQDHDMLLRVVERCTNIVHIPEAVYHWRCHEASTAAAPEAKMYAFDSGRRAVEDHLKRCGIPAHVILDTHLGYYRTCYDWEGEPLVSIVIPNKDHADDLMACVDSIVEKNTYKNIEFIIVENNSSSPDIHSVYRQLSERSDIKVKVVDFFSENQTKDFNFSALVNFGVKHSEGEYILLLNNDTRLIEPDSIKEMLDVARRKDVGAVGARLYYGNNTVQHAGIILGLGGVANSAFLGSGRDQVGYFYRSTTVSDLSAVTGACLMTARSHYDAVGGFDEGLAVAYNDVDFCLKQRKAGRLVVYVPYSQWYHLESVSRGLDCADDSKRARLEEETEIFKAKWPKETSSCDPYYNKNLSTKKLDFSIRED